MAVEDIRRGDLMEKQFTVVDRKSFEWGSFEKEVLAGEYAFLLSLEYQEDFYVYDNNSLRVDPLLSTREQLI